MEQSAPDGTAVRVALWRALHLEVDEPPHVIADDIGRALAQPESDWRSHGDMHPIGTAGFRASIVGRARFLDDLVRERAATGVGQYVILGAGLDTFAQRHPDVAASLQIYEVDQPGTQAWKRRRLAEEGYQLPEGLHFVPVDFEMGESWWDALKLNGFDADSPAVVSSTGVSMYLTREATDATLRQVAALAPGSTLAMTFMLPLDLLDDVERPMLAGVEAQARASGTPFISHYAPDELVDMCRAAGFASARVVGPDELTERYFAGRGDGLRPPSAEQFVVATV
ncbi:MULTISPECIES: class I SAM-dependent methyltransferase [unclassified Mycobacterium]|uniref:class I SAM-dependent methyltransferase n=1 Tax=unclassified Mycobacterium TaxID=2642494 RepID=UPI0029C7933A|nr:MULTISPECIES: class I SAM-dependent methyltransferase [unclassified Mycobacterium]